MEKKTIAVRDASEAIDGFGSFSYHEISGE